MKVLKGLGSANIFSKMVRAQNGQTFAFLNQMAVYPLDMSKTLGLDSRLLGGFRS